MSFYDTTNPTRFNIITPKRAVAPFGALNRLSSTVALSSGAAVAGDITLTAEQLKNGSLIVDAVTGALNFILPSAYALQQFLGGAKVVGDHVNGTSNEYFILDVYNLSTNGNGTVSAGTDGTGSKIIAAAATQNDARLTPVLIQFTAVGEDGTAAYSLY